MGTCAVYRPCQKLADTTVPCISAHEPAEDQAAPSYSARSPLGSAPPDSSAAPLPVAYTRSSATMQCTLPPAYPLISRCALQLFPILNRHCPWGGSTGCLSLPEPRTKSAVSH